MMLPLEANEIADIDTSTPKSERFWSYIPILGWTLANIMWGERTRPIVNKIERQLESRSQPDSGLWGASETKIALAQFVCKVAAEEMGWPNAYFIPDDPAGVVFWAHDDGLDVESAVIEIERHLGIELEDRDVISWFNMTLGEVVELLWVRHQSVHNQEGVWPPPPDY